MSRPAPSTSTPWRAHRGALAVLLSLALTPAAASAGPKKGKKKDFELPPDICAEVSCRELSYEERASFGRVLAKIMAALPTPDPERFEQTGLKSIQGLAPFFVSDAVWQSPAFPSNVVDTMAVAYKDGTFPRALSLVYTYNRKGGAGGQPHTAADGEIEVYDLRLQVTAFPAPAVVSQLAKAEQFRQLEKTATALLVEVPLKKGEASGDKRYAVLVGARRSKPEEAKPVGGTPPEKLAQVWAVRVDVQGPAEEALALAKKLDRKALLALMPPPANTDMPKPKEKDEKGKKGDKDKKGEEDGEK